MKPKDLSLIIPIYNEAGVIQQALAQLIKLKPWLREIILVDGGSSDATCEMVGALMGNTDQVKLIKGPKGRAAQMQAGAKQALSGQLLFCHIDTLITPEHINAISIEECQWGCFDLHLDDKAWIYRIIETLINWRSKISGISTGDQCLLVSTDLFLRVGGFADIPLMEDIEICQRLKQHQPPLRFKPAVVTSSRRWQEQGVTKTILMMWRLRFAYWRGIPAEQLVKIYYPHH